MKMPGLKSLFLSTALLISGAAKSQVIPGKPLPVEPRLSRSFDQSKKDISKTLPITGVLFVVGPEYPDSTSYIKNTEKNIRKFHKTFKHNPHIVVGGAQGEVTDKAVQGALEELGKESDEIFIINSLHGDKDKLEWVGTSGKLIAATTNIMSAEIGGTKKFTSNDLYFAIGTSFRKSPHLKDKPLTVLATSCYAGSGAMDFTELPPGTELVTWSDHNHLAANRLHPFFEVMERAPSYNRITKQNKMRQSSLVVNAIYAANADHYSNKNTPYVFSITATTPDSLVLHNKTEAAGTYGGTVINCIDQANRLTELYSVENIYKAVDGKTHILLPELVEHIVYESTFSKHMKDINQFEGHRRGMMCVMAYLTAKEHPKKQQSIASYIQQEKLFYAVDPTTTSSKNSFPLQPPSP